MSKEAAVRERFVELRAAGWSLARIAGELGVSKPTLIKWSREAAPEISAEQYCRMEELSERLGLLRECRLQAFGELLGRVRRELAGRSLEDISTIRLLRMALDLEERLGADMEGIRYREESFTERWGREQLEEYTICLPEQ